MRILLVEDETTLRQSLNKQLSQKGMVVVEAADGEEGYYFAVEYPFDVAVIDLGLPKLSGVELIQKIRSCPLHFPILILTARSQWQDKVKGLEAGADDYLTKPFHFEELFARLNALVRRSAGWSESVLRCGPIELNTLQQTVHVKSRPIAFTSHEYRILEYLMLHAGKVISKTELTEHVYHQDFERDSNVLEVLVGRLRRKLDPMDEFKPIETLRGRGYRLTLPVKKS